MRSSRRMQAINKTWAFIAPFRTVLLLAAFVIGDGTSAVLGGTAGAMPAESDWPQTTPTTTSDPKQIENAPTSSMPVEESVGLPRYPLVAGDSPEDAIWIYEGLNGPFDNTLATSEPFDCVFTCFHNGWADGSNTMWFKFLVDDPNNTATVRTCPTSDAADTIVALYEFLDPDDPYCSLSDERACGEDECGYSGFMSELCAGGLEDYDDLYPIYLQVASYAPEYAGEFWIELILNTECAEPIVGACCNPEDASCSLATWETCRQLDGIHSGDGTSCADVTCTGACCAPDGSCEDTPQQACTENFQGISTTCATVDCPLAPVNDDCLTAEPLGPVPVSVTASNVSARLDDTPDCEIPPPYRGMWYVVQGTGNTMTATTCNSITDIDTMLHVWCGDCEYLLDRFCLGGNDDECEYARYFSGVRSTVNWCSMEGAEYYILVGGYGNETGTFRLNVYDDGETCPDPINCNAEGACCIDGTCAVMPPGLCALGGGTYVADDVACDPDPCGGNDDCLHAQDAGPLPATAVANNALAGDDSPGLCGAIPLHHGVWYEVTGTGNVITATTCNETTALDTVIQVWCGDCEYLTCVTASDDDCSDILGFGSTVSWCSVPGRTYHVLVGGFGEEVGTFELEMTDSGIACSDPVSCPVPQSACCIEGTCSPLTPDACALAGGIFAGADIACDPDPCQQGACCFADGTCQDLSEADCAGTYQGGGTLCSVTPCPGPGDDCADPMVLTFGLDDLPLTHVTSTCGRGDDFLAYASSIGDGEDMVYQLVITEQMTIDIKVAAEALVFQIYIDGYCPPAADPDPSIGYGNLAWDGHAAINDVHIWPGTYHLSVDSYLPAYCMEQVTLTISESPEGACCAIDGTCRVTDERDCAWFTPGGPGSYVGDGTSCDPSPCALGACCTATECAVTTEEGCDTAGGTYQGNLTSCDPSPCLPVNDDCANAIPITDGSVVFNTNSATTDGPAHEECDIDGQTYNDIWYSYEATCSGTLLVSTCDDADFDTELVVYSGWDCDHVLLDCNDDSTLCGDDTSLVTVPATVGARFTIRVGGFRGESRGVGTLTVVCLDEGACCHDFSGFGCSFMDEALCLDIGGDYGGEGSACVAEDCNANEVIDVCDIAAGSSQDCNLNGVPDDCDITGGHNCCAFDHGPGCSHPLIRDCVCAIDPYCCDVEWDRLCVFEVTGEGCGDCDADNDCNGTGILDECETIITGDFDGNGLIELSDYAGFHACLSLPCGELQCDPPVYEDYCCYLADFDADGDADLQDFTSLQEGIGNR